MSDLETTEYVVSVLGDVAREVEPPRAELDRLSKLPLEALFYYVLYGDEQLARLT